MRVGFRATSLCTKQGEDSNSIMLTSSVGLVLGCSSLVVIQNSLQHVRLSVEPLMIGTTDRVQAIVVSCDLHDRLNKSGAHGSHFSKVQRPSKAQIN